MKKFAALSAILLIVVSLLTLAVPLNSAMAGGGGYDNAYVDASRPHDSGDGSSWATAKKYIQSGIHIVKNGGTVHVAAGTYYEDGTLNVYHSCNIIGAGAPKTIIDGRGKYQVLRVSSLIGQENTISGFTIQNGASGIGGKAENTVQKGMPVGGGVYVAMGHILNMNDCTISNNVSGFMGGGIYNAGELTLNRCTVSGNSAFFAGGGIVNFHDYKVNKQEPYPVHVDDGTITLVNCTISGNRVEDPNIELLETAEDSKGVAETKMPFLGAGVYNGGNASFTNVTIADNSISLEREKGTKLLYEGPEAHGGGFANVPMQCANDQEKPVFKPVASFRNTIVADNQPDNGYSYLGTVTSLGYNLDSEDSCGFNQPTDQRNADPLLGPLQDNGGPTFTCAITPNSPAYNKGTADGAPSTDQRGIDRPQWRAFDIGAYECTQPPLNRNLAGSGQSSNPGLAPGSYSYSPPVIIPTVATRSASISAQTVTPGTPVTVTADIANTSTVNGTKKITLYVNGQVEAVQGVTVNSGSTSQLNFTVTRNEPGTYSVYVDSAPAGSFTVDAFSNNEVLIYSIIALLTTGIIGTLFALARKRTA